MFATTLLGSPRLTQQVERNIILSGRVVVQTLGKPISYVPSAYGLHADLALHRFPSVLHERELLARDVAAPHAHANKAFAIEWLNNDTVLIGTKDNKLLCYSLATLKAFEVPLPTPVASLTEPEELCGIHAIVRSPSHSTVVSGSSNPCDVALFSAPRLQPAAVLRGHRDWVFGCQYLDDSLLVTVSRDSTVRLWDVRLDEDTIIDTDVQYHRTPLLTRIEHTRKVRAVCMNGNTKILATLSADLTLKLWDTSNMNVISSAFLNKVDLVCVAASDEYDVFAVGSREHITLIDPRAKAITDVPNQDHTWGVRSISFNRSVITAGGGHGRLSFFDIRLNGWIPTENDANYLQSSPAWLKASGQSTFHGLDITNAIFAHRWDPHGARLLVAGGPLMIGLEGCYIAVWS